MGIIGLQCQNSKMVKLVDKVSKVCSGCSEDITDDFRLTAMNMHNYYRRLLATGWAVDKKIYYAKPAKTMNKLVYVKTLEDAALNYISCDKEVPENDPPVGESFWKGSYELSHVDAMKEAMKEWWQPLEATGLGDELSYTNEMQQGPFKYFANIAHDKTTEIGCAVKTCLKQGTTLIDCRYNNVISVDDPIYEVGTMPCRPCPTNSACSKLGGLCEINPTP
ncbi:hypothetical protein Y032_0194g1415 [Ancylostoma ceylanicum]|uniref:SCP domain-containing protein n=1 Tax=Ancylostoma ceylanicum TaxID=53326 RepID=A0A016SNV1_9BILA|nr:hypothetical protein Y032_0194g1415 [Ancylostoma ceylanicum]